MSSDNDSDACSRDTHQIVHFLDQAGWPARLTPPPEPEVSSGDSKATKKAGDLYPLVDISCCICLEEETGIIVTLCRHVFCENCLSDLLKQPADPTCPTCDTPLPHPWMAPVLESEQDSSYETDMAAIEETILTDRLRRQHQELCQDLARLLEDAMDD